MIFSRKEETNMHNRKKYKDERRYSWLTILLDIYAINDFEMNKYIKAEEKRRKSKIVCERGCSNCCKNNEIIISSLEVRGILWYITEVIDYNLQEMIKNNIRENMTELPCLFLINDICSIYEMRPLTCRSYYVFNKACGSNENILNERKQDLLWGDQKIAKKVAMRFLDDESYNLKSMKAKEMAFNEGIMLTSGKFLHDMDMTKVIKHINMFQKIRFNKE